MTHPFYISAIAMMAVAFGLSLMANQPRTCAQEFTAGYTVGVKETTKLFREAQGDE